MSATSYDQARQVFAANAAAALREALAAPQWQGRRLLLRSLHGLSPAQMMGALLSGATTTEIDVFADGPGGPASLITALVLSSGTHLIAYLVETGPSTPNVGTGGYAAALRTHFLEGAVAPRVLLILDGQPPETVRSTSDDAALLPELEWDRLCESFALPSAANVQPSALVREVAADYIARSASEGRTDWRQADQLRRWVENHRDDPDRVVGASLYELGNYVSDPGAHVGNQRRLALAATWRTDLEEWVSSPGQDLGRRLAARRVGAQGIEAVLAANTLRGLDHSRFTLDDLLVRGGRDPLTLNWVRPVAEGVRLALQHDNALTLWLSVGGGSLGFRMNRPVGHDEHARIRWQGEPAVELQTRGSMATTSVAAPLTGAWRFGWLELLESHSVVKRYAVAAWFSAAECMAFEQGLDIDPELGGFNCADEPVLGVWNSEGRELGVAELDADRSPSESETVHLVTGTFRGSAVGPVPVIPAKTTYDDDDPIATSAIADAKNDQTETRLERVATDRDIPPGESDNWRDDDEQDTDLLLQGAHTGRGQFTAASAEQPTFTHAMLAFHQPTWPEQASTPTESVIAARFGAIGLRIQPRVSGKDLLGIEQAILRHPEWCMFSVSGNHCVSLREFPRPEPAWEAHLEAFLRARADYFAAALAAGSTYALDPRGQASRRYTATYRALLQVLPRAGTSRTEYDDLLLVDCTEVGGVPDLLFAPTSPLTVAFHAALTERFARMAGASAELNIPDIEAFTPQYLLPLLQSGGDWYESAPCDQAVLWRRYVPLASSSPGALERNSSFIASRIAFFLSVHPGLNDPSTTIAVTFAEPGDGSAAIEALRHFYRLDRGSASYRRPKLKAMFAGASREARQSVNAFLSGASDNDLSRIVRTRSDLIIEPEGSHMRFSDLAFLFRSPGARTVRPVRLDERAGTNYARSLACRPGRVRLSDANYVFATGTFCPTPDPNASDLEAIQYRSLELVGGQGGERLEEGWTRMAAATASEQELGRWYDNSAWVVHLDRTVGLEAFAESHARRVLLEYEEGADPASSDYDGITGTRHLEPYLAALKHALQGVARPAVTESRNLMRLLEGVSGRWALQIVQKPLPKVLERAGTACAIRYLVEIDRGLDHGDGMRAIVALEELVPRLPGSGIPRRLLASRAGRGAMCDDLLLLAVHTRPGRPPLVQASVIEVKYWSSQAPDYSRAAAQVEETVDWLHEHFCDPGEMLDLRGRDLAELIRSASTRNSAFGLGANLPAGAEDVLERIAGGEYEFEFGHWRRGAYRRGLVVSVEQNRAGTMELLQINGQHGPLDLVSVRDRWVQAFLEMRTLVAPTTWTPLSTRPPEAEARGSIAVASGPLPTLPGSSGSAIPADLGEELEQDARRLDEAFAKYGLAVEPFSAGLAQAGPSVIRFRTRAVGRLSISDIERRARDISREVGAAGGVTIGDEPGFIRVDVPRAQRQVVPLSAALEALDREQGKPGALSFVAGMAPSGDVRIADLSRLPHLLVSGATGSGKSVFLRGLLLELLRARTPEQLSLLIIDPKRLDFTPFARTPHLLGGEIISDSSDALERLQFTLDSEIERRQPVLADAGVSSATEFYESGRSLEKLPQLVILIDEFADLVLAGTDKRSFGTLIQRYAQLTRAYGVFLVLATQRPSVDVVTGSIKANLSARIAFSLPSARDSMTILDRGGAEDLLGDGDLLFYRSGKVDRLQAPLATLADVRKALS